MLTVVATNYFLLAISWAIINSIWQGLIMWLIYKLVSYQKTSALFKYHLGLTSFSVLFAFFIYNLIEGWNIFSQPSFINNSISFWSLQGNSFIQQFPVFFKSLSMGYLLTCFIKSSRLISRIVNITKLKNGSYQKAPLDYRLFANKTALHLGINKKVQLWMCKNVQIPCVSGFLKPVILLPFTLFNDLDTEQAEAIIVHELAHVKRHDYLINLLQSIAHLVLFFNPFALLLSSAIRKERENCCDDWVISYNYDRQLYASALLQLEQNRQQNILLLPAATNGKRWLLQRIKRLFSDTPSVEISGFEKLKLTGITIIVCLVLLLIPPVTKNDQPISIKIEKEKSLVSTVFENSLLPENVGAVKIRNDASAGMTAALEPSKLKNSKRIKRNNSREGKKSTYTVALVNKELLEQDELAKTVSTNISFGSNTDSIQNSYLIKVEIEQSGSSSTSSYLFEYNKDKDGTAVVKPLILTSKKTNPKSPKSRDSQNQKSTVSSKNKRITL